MRPGEGEGSQLVFWPRTATGIASMARGEHVAKHVRTIRATDFMPRCFHATEHALSITQTWCVSSSLFLIESFLMGNCR
jgi:hypothetical protein